MEKFREIVFMLAWIGNELHDSKMEYLDRIFWPFVIICSIPVVLLFLLIIDAEITGWYKDKMLKRGFYHKEFPIDKVEVNIADVYKKQKASKIKGKKFSISLTYKPKKKYTRNANEAESSVRANKQIKSELSEYVIRKMAEGEVCLLVRSAGVYQKRDKGEITESEERERSFRLDTSYSWEKKKNDAWLEGLNTVTNNAGQIIGVRGIDEATLSLGYDIYIPDVSEEILRRMSLTEMLRFCDSENCKLQIKDRGNVFITSELAGFTKEDVIKTIMEAAEHRAIKAKIKNRGSF